MGNISQNCERYFKNTTITVADGRKFSPVDKDFTCLLLLILLSRLFKWCMSMSMRLSFSAIPATRRLVPGANSRRRSLLQESFNKTINSFVKESGDTKATETIRASFSDIFVDSNKFTNDSKRIFYTKVSRKS